MLKEFLPLNCKELADFDVTYALQADALEIVAEKVERVPDLTRPPSCRIDLFAYLPDNSVVRHHPGKTNKSSMTPHRMEINCDLFDVKAACKFGVGTFLYQTPPGYVGGHYLDVPLCTRQHMDQMCTYDVQQLNTRLLLDRVAKLVPVGTVQDWSYGNHFPWWVWLANTGAIRRTVDDGVFTFIIYNKVPDKRVTIRVRSTNCQYEITFPHGGRVAVREVD